MKAGARIIFESDEYVLNPVQVVCPICLEVKVLRSMNQLHSLVQHIKEKHFEDTWGTNVVKRLDAWIENNYNYFKRAN